MYTNISDEINFQEGILMSCPSVVWWHIYATLLLLLLLVKPWWWTGLGEGESPSIHQTQLLQALVGEWSIYTQSFNIKGCEGCGLLTKVIRKCLPFSHQ